MIDLAAANHTNRELELMLCGKKPLAVFYDYTIHLPDEEIIPEHRFKAYVEEGRFIRGEHTFDLGYDEKLGIEAKLKYVFFAISSEAWRIPAFILLKSVFLKTGRNPEELERMESRLLGYTEAEVDAWCDRMYRTKRA